MLVRMCLEIGGEVGAVEVPLGRDIRSRIAAFRTVESCAQSRRLFTCMVVL